MSVDVTLTPAFKAAVPRALFQAPTFFAGVGFGVRRWDLAGDGQRFLINTGASEASGPITVLLTGRRR